MKKIRFIDLFQASIFEMLRFYYRKKNIFSFLVGFSIISFLISFFIPYFIAIIEFKYVYNYYFHFLEAPLQPLEIPVIFNSFYFTSVVFSGGFYMVFYKMLLHSKKEEGISRDYFKMMLKEITFIRCIIGGIIGGILIFIFQMYFPPEEPSLGSILYYHPNFFKEDAQIILFHLVPFLIFHYTYSINKREIAWKGIISGFLLLIVSIELMFMGLTYVVERLNYFFFNLLDTNILFMVPFVFAAGLGIVILFLPISAIGMIHPMVLQMKAEKNMNEERFNGEESDPEVL